MGRSAVVLAAGLGTRMKSQRHKVLHEVCGKPMLVHILDTLETLSLDQLIVVTGQQHEAVEAMVANRAQIARQTEQLGTGHAVQAALPHLHANIDSVVVLYGDAPLVSVEAVLQLFEAQQEQAAAAVVLTADVPNPDGLGRVIEGPDGSVLQIVEERDATSEQRLIHRINTGIYAFNRADLESALARVLPTNAQGEFYLTDTVAILRELGRPVYGVPAADPDEVLSVNDRVQLAAVERVMQRRICEHWMRAGVTMIDPGRVVIGADVELGRDTVVYPGAVLEGRTVVGTDCVIGPNARIVDSTIEAGARVESSVVLSSQIGPGTTVGPFAYVRPESRIGAGVKIGDFVEVKKSVIGDRSKVSHLAYVGDADIGSDVNVGCGAITVNYDGQAKHRTVVGDGSFVGSNVNLIAPVEIGAGAYLCAGSTITDNVPDDGFAIARGRQVTKPNYVKAWKQRGPKPHQ